MTESNEATEAILLVDDNPTNLQLLFETLDGRGYKLLIAKDGKTALSIARKAGPNLILLDIMMPEIDGYEVCRQLKADPATAEIPVIFLSALTDTKDKVQGLDLGAVDYVTKPFSIRELMARVKAIFRRIDELKSNHQADKQTIIRVGEMAIDPEKRKVTLKNKTIDLTAKEFDLLLHFAQNAGKVFTRAHLLDEVWGYGHDGYEHTVNSHINRLRAKIEKNPAQPVYILTVWGVGYKFAELDD